MEGEGGEIKVLFYLGMFSAIGVLEAGSHHHENEGREKPSTGKEVERLQFKRSAKGSARGSKEIRLISEK